MITEIFPPSSSFAQVAHYHLGKINRQKATVIGANMFVPEKNGRYSINKFIRILERQSALSRRIKNPVFHCALNPVPGEQLSDELYIKFAHDYMSEMGYGDQPYIIVRHNDIEREHIHILTTRIDYNGKKISNNNERYKSKFVTEKLVKKYALRTYLTNKEKLEKGIKNPQKYKNDEKTNFEQMHEIIKHVTKKYRFHSMGDYIWLINKFGIDAANTERELKDGTKRKGIVYFGLENSQRVTKPINPKEIGRGSGVSALERMMKENKIKSEPLFEQLRGFIDENVITSSSIEEFCLKMQNLGFEVILKQTADKSRIYGISFYSENQSFIVSGSTLGREYSAANILKRLSESEQLPLSQEQEKSNNETSVHQEQNLPEEKETPENIIPLNEFEDESQEEEEDISHAGGIGIPGGNNESEYRKRGRKYKNANRKKI